LSQLFDDSKIFARLASFEETRKFRFTGAGVELGIDWIRSAPFGVSSLDSFGFDVLLPPDGFVVFFLKVADRKACGTFDSPLLFSKAANAAPNLEESFPGLWLGRLVVAIVTQKINSRINNVESSDSSQKAILLRRYPR